MRDLAIADPHGSSRMASPGAGRCRRCRADSVPALGVREVPQQGGSLAVGTAACASNAGPHARPAANGRPGHSLALMASTSFGERELPSVLDDIIAGVLDLERMPQDRVPLSRAAKWAGQPRRRRKDFSRNRDGAASRSFPRGEAFASWQGPRYPRPVASWHRCTRPGYLRVSSARLSSASMEATPTFTRCRSIL